MLNWIWSRFNRADAPPVAARNRLDRKPHAVFLQQLCFFFCAPVPARVDSGSAVCPLLQFLQDAVQCPDDLRPVIDALVRQRLSRHGVDAIGKSAKQFGCAIDLHMLTFSLFSFIIV